MPVLFWVLLVVVVVLKIALDVLLEAVIPYLPHIVYGGLVWLCWLGVRNAARRCILTAEALAVLVVLAAASSLVVHSLIPPGRSSVLVVLVTVPLWLLLVSGVLRAWSAARVAAHEREVRTWEASVQVARREAAELAKRREQAHTRLLWLEGGKERHARALAEMEATIVSLVGEDPMVLGVKRRIVEQQAAELSDRELDDRIAAQGTSTLDELVLRLARDHRLPFEDAGALAEQRRRVQVLESEHGRAVEEVSRRAGLQEAARRRLQYAAGHRVRLDFGLSAPAAANLTVGPAAW